MRRLGWLLLLVSPVLLAWTEADETRFRQLTEELRCLVCQNQSIAASQAPLAEDLRRQVRQRIENGETNAEIRAYMTARYGDFVLYRPPLKSTTYALWFGPVVLLLIGALLVWRLRRRPAVAAEEPVPSKDVEAILRRTDHD